MSTAATPSTAPSPTPRRSLSAGDCRLLRDSKGLSLSWVAARAGYSKTYLSMIERGLRPLTPEVELKLLQILWTPRS